MSCNKRITDIRIDWEGPFSLYDIGYIEKEDKYIIKNSKLNNESRDYGIYQIYGYHPVYGDNVLLYIGQANDQTFARRISQEGWEYNVDYRNIEIYIGRIFNIDNDDALNEDGVWGRAIEDAEKMLIYSHSPAMNSSNILTITRNKDKLKEMEKIRILNYGTHRSLNPETSGEMWIKELESVKLFGEEK